MPVGAVLVRHDLVTMLELFFPSLIKLLICRFSRRCYLISPSEEGRLLKLIILRNCQFHSFLLLLFHLFLWHLSLPLIFQNDGLVFCLVVVEEIVFVFNVGHGVSYLV